MRSLWIPILSLTFIGFIITFWWRLKVLLRRKRREFRESEIFSPKNAKLERQYSRGKSKLAFVDDTGKFKLQKNPLSTNFLDAYISKKF